jgi:hypothetical protein
MDNQFNHKMEKEDENRLHKTNKVTKDFCKIIHLGKSQRENEIRAK